MKEESVEDVQRTDRRLNMHEVSCVPAVTLPFASSTVVHFAMNCKDILFVSLLRNLYCFEELLLDGTIFPRDPI